MRLVNKVLIVLLLFTSIPFSQAKDSKLVSSTLYEKDLLGQWRVKEILFLDLPSDIENKFTSYFMHQGIVRYEFKDANEFTYVVPNKKKNRPEDGKYWTWSFDLTKQSFVVNQISLQSPPFNFGLNATIKKVSSFKDYKEIVLDIVFKADNTKAIVILTNLNDENWDLPPLVSKNQN